MNRNPVSESYCWFRRGSHSLLRLSATNVERIIDENKPVIYVWTLAVACVFAYVFVTMHRSTRIGLIGLAVLVCVVVVVVLLNLNSIKSTTADDCTSLDGSKTCHSANTKPYRHYGTKTMYHVALEDGTADNFHLDGCTPKVFYMLSRHAARHPDKDGIKEMIRTLPNLKEKIINSSLSGKSKLCEEDLDGFRKWRSNLNPKDDNQISKTGKIEAESLGQRLRAKFPSILSQEYSSKNFIFEYTNKERTKTTAKAFAKGLFDKDIDFEGKENKALTFHKECKDFQKECEKSLIDTSEVVKFEEGPLIQKVNKSISERVGFNVSLDEMYVIYKACVFGYALNTSDIWCSLFSAEELKVLEFGGDIDDYYKDAYGNALNYEQACPVTKYIVNLFKANENTNGTKAVFQFSHSGAMKKVYSLFGLFRDETDLTADGYCSQKDRKWHSSTIVPFNSNIVLVLYQCNGDLKVVAFHHERSIQIHGCAENACPLSTFYENFEPLSKSCNIRKLCCSCCKG